MSARQLEELNRRQVERDIGSALVEVDLGQVISGAIMCEPGTRVCNVNVKPIGIGWQVEEAHPSFDNLRIDFYGVDLYLGSGDARCHNSASRAHPQYQRVTGANQKRTQSEVVVIVACPAGQRV